MPPALAASTTAAAAAARRITRGRYSNCASSASMEAKRLSDSGDSPRMIARRRYPGTFESLGGSKAPVAACTARGLLVRWLSRCEPLWEEPGPDSAPFAVERCRSKGHTP